MQNVTNHPVLIRANIYLAQGDKAEARRMLGVYLKQHKPTNLHDDPFILWLDAQTRSNFTERLQQLRLLVATTPSDNPYHQLAKQTLAIDEDYKEPRQRIANSRLWLGIIMILVAIVAVVWLFSNLFGSPNNPTQILSTEITAEITENALETPIPVRLTPLAPEVSFVDYDEGILMFTAIEDNSLRVINRFSGESVKPVAGARFFVLFVTFECRIGICNEPPEATLTLIQTDEFTFQSRDDLIVGDMLPLMPVAFGIQTSGAFIFEIPFVGLPTTLEVLPKSEKGAPLTINLPVQ